VTVATLGGIAAAAAAAACFDGGLALQAMDARREPRSAGLRPRLLLQLAQRRHWLAATGLALAGWPFHLLALGLAPLSLVQPTLALGLVLLLYLGHRILGERVGRAEVAAVAGVVGAVAVLAWAAPAETSHHAGTVRVAAGLGPLALIALLPAQRTQDVLLLDMTDTQRPVALSPLDASMGFTRDQAVANLMASFERIWHDFWGPRMAYFLRNVCLLLYTLNERLVQEGRADEQFTLLDINPLLQY